VAAVCSLNNYPLKKMWDLSRTGSVPRQHVWGVDALAAEGHIVDFAPFHEPGDRNLLDRFSSYSRGLLGHVDQEVYAMRRMARTDVLYCADQTGLAGLALARGVLPRARFISVVHHPIHNVVRRTAAASHDVLVCLSAVLCMELTRELPRRRARIVHLPWGPDLTCPLYRSRGERNGVVSAGKSNRDLVTLAKALDRTGAGGIIYDLAQQISTPPNTAVRLVHSGYADGTDPDAPGQYVAERVLTDIAAASIVAVPVRDPRRLTGLTEVVDALALAKPIVATESPYFPFDIEAVGCGIWVAPGDVDGWTRAIGELLADTDARIEMGTAGRRFAERHWNYDTFSEGLLDLMRK
jgi:glycosyltransferase involved in cell wall biosynthesis